MTKTSKKWTRVFSTRRWVILVARTRRKKKKKIVCPLLDVFAFGQVPSPRLYRLTWKMYLMVWIRFFFISEISAISNFCWRLHPWDIAHLNIDFHFWSCDRRKIFFSLSLLSKPFTGTFFTIKFFSKISEISYEIYEKDQNHACI